MGQNTTVVAQRIVLKHITGLMQIVGHLGDYAGVFPGIDVECDIVTPGQEPRRGREARFVHAYDRYLLYEEQP